MRSQGSSICLGILAAKVFPHMVRVDVKIFVPPLFITVRHILGMPPEVSSDNEDF